MKPSLLIELSRAAKKCCIAMEGVEYRGKPDAADFREAFRKLLEEQDPALLEILEQQRG